MGTKSTSRASYQQHGNIKFGQKRAVCDSVERGQINQAINHLALAKKATSEEDMLYHLSNAMKYNRHCYRGRAV